MKKILYLGVFLGITASVATAALAGVNQITAPIIQSALEAAFREAVAVAFPTAGHFEVLPDDSGNPYIVEILEVFEQGETIGFVFTKRVNGFSGAIDFMVGVDTEGRFTSFTTLSHSETPGFGDVIETEEWSAQIVGYQVGRHIDIVSGVTVTTEPIIRALATLYYEFAEGGD